MNELKLAKGKNCLIFAISERPARLKELIESDGFDVRELSLKGKENLLEMLLTWEDTTENTIYVVHEIANQFPWVLPYLNLHRDLFFDIKRPVVVLGSEYEVTEIQKHAPDWFRFRSRTYELKEEELEEEGVIMSLAELAEPKPLYYSLPVFVEEGEEEIKERIKIDEYLLSSEHDDYKLAELYMSLSLSYFKLRNFERGEEYLRKSTAIREKLKDNKGILLNYGRLSSIFVGIGEYEKTIDASNEALKIDPGLAVVYIYRGIAYAELKQHERAIEDYKKTIALNPDEASAYYNRGIAYANLKRYERAIEDYGKAIALNPNDAEVYNNRGLAYSGLSQQGRAIEDYNKAIALNPNYAQAYNNRGNAYARLKQYEQAIEDYNNTIELNPSYAETYNNRGTAYARLNQHKRAIEDYSKAIELNSNLAQAYNNRGNAYHGLNQHKRAIEDYSKAIALNPNYAHAYSNRGNAYVDLKQYERAIEDYGGAIALNPDDVKAYGNRGKAHSAIRRYEESARDFKKAGILFLSFEKVDDSVKHFSFCFDLREELKSEDVIHSGLALFLITLNPDIIIELKQLQIEDETLRKIFELTLMKLQDEDISEGIAMLEEKEQTEENKILFELLKRL
ncbi:Tetratricopeptide (TPR) repeat protein [Methanophagales archaeon]|nr:Tetratricopeptide (TPR) repeat protein [Methanophagales archaeon]